VPEWLVIARREFAERVRTVWFAIVTLLGPIALVGIMVIPACLASSASEEAVIIEVVDRSGSDLLPGLARHAALMGGRFELRPAAPDTGEADLLRHVRDRRVNGFLLIPPDVLGGGAAIYRGDNATNLMVRGRLQLALNEAAKEARARAVGISSDALRELSYPPVELVARHDTGRGEVKSAEASFVAGYAVMFVLYVAILLYAVNVMRSVIQEKTSRVIEIVVSAVKPRTLMLGKVIGVGSVGLLQLTIWSVVSLVLVNYRGDLLALLGIGSGGGAELPPLDAVDVVVILAYFAAGYFFYAALYAAIGAMVNSDQEGQQLQTPLTLLLVVPVMCVTLVANHPRGGAAQVLTLVPLSSPILMPMRYLLGGATWPELALSLALLLLFTAGAVALAGRIYRVGILMYGKRASLRELARWIRHG
jgi:ABC-2 type transport system permease protein